MHAVIIPAAGLGTRLRPLTLETPKEMLSLGGRPALWGALLEIRALECEAVVVLSPRKPSLQDWLDREAPELPTVIQPEPAGVLDAVEWGRHRLGFPESCIVLFPDYIQLPQQQALKQMLALAQDPEASYYGLIQMNAERARRMGRSAQVQVKPLGGSLYRLLELESAEPEPGAWHTCFIEIRGHAHQAALDASTPEDQNLQGILRDLAMRGLLYGVDLGEVLDLGVMHGYQDALARFQEGRASWRSP